jgi:uncharacterized membrane protein YeaQ/YmgE (transglycosylase-associated protein family)
MATGNQARLLVAVHGKCPVCLYKFNHNQEVFMEEQQIGWFAAIVVGGLAGWLAEQFMKGDHGLLTNIILGIIGAIVANALLGLLGVSFGGWLGYLIAGFIGACILIALKRMLKR